jgi:phospholipase C
MHRPQSHNKRAAVCLILLSAGLSHATSNVQRVKHVVIIVQENRTPDNLFHGLPNADIANSGINSKGKKIVLTPIPLANNYDLNHIHEAFNVMYDDGRMDRADKNPVHCGHAKHCPPPNPQFKYVSPSEVRPYFKLAEQYTFADRMFQTNQGASFPAHQFLIAGTSAPTADSRLFDAENPKGLAHTFHDSGCTAPLAEYVEMIDPAGQESSRQFPCFEHLTLMDLLDQQGLSWRYYTPTAGVIWTAPNAIFHLRFGPDWSNVILQPSKVLSDIKDGQLSTVSWVMPKGQESDHPASNRGLGPSWVASIVNTIGASPYWNDTVIFILWDDWGGWYDHVPPPTVIKNRHTWGSGYVYGFRVPLIIVSPFAKKGYVSHRTHDFGSILNFVEGVFGLPSLGYADAHADDFSDCFNFEKAGHAFHTIPAPYDANYFLNDTEPATDPDDD